MIFVTYMSNDRDLKGVIFLAYNLKMLKSKYQLGCTVIENVSEETKDILRKNNIIIFEYNFQEILTGHGFTKEQTKSIIDIHHIGKLLFLNLQLERVIYLDSDLLLLRNIDHLFETTNANGFHMVQDMVMHGDGFREVSFLKNKFNAGVIVSNNNNGKFHLFMSELSKLIGASSKCLVCDQQLFNHMFSKQMIHIQLLDLKYNIPPLIIQQSHEQNIIRYDDIHIIHFILQPKPWDLLSGTNRFKFPNEVMKLLYYKWLDEYNRFIKTECMFNDVDQVLHFNWK